MRKVTKQIKEAFEAGKYKTIGNTSSDSLGVTLHGNRIISRKKDGSILWTLSGWNTPTTRERLNGILGLGLCCKSFVCHLGSQEIDEMGWYTISGVKVY
jgi:hypothetical protein